MKWSSKNGKNAWNQAQAYHFWDKDKFPKSYHNTPCTPCNKELKENMTIKQRFKRVATNKFEESQKTKYIYNFPQPKYSPSVDPFI
jgi:hypothetical protein